MKNAPKIPLCKQKLNLQHKEKGDLAAALILANKLSFLSVEKENIAAELSVANI